MASTQDCTLGDPQQVITDLQRQLAERTAERDEAFQQQTATAEVLQVINSSPGDVAPVFATILDKAHTLCGADCGSLFLLDNQAFRAAAVLGYPNDLADRLHQGGSLTEAAAFAPLLAGEPLVHTPDLAQVDDSQSRVVAERGGVRTNLLLPLRKDGVLLGVISCNRQEVRPFTDKQIALLQNFAAQAVIAIENARLITETKEALEQQTATAEVLGVINSSPGNLTPVFDTMLKRAVQLCEAAFGHLIIYDGERFSPVSAIGEPQIVEWLKQRGPVKPGAGTTMERIVRGERVVQIEDIKDDAAFRNGDPTRRALVEIGGARTLLSLALSNDKAVLGVISIYRQEVRSFSEREIALLQNFAAQAVIAMENARLITETREALEQQTATADVLGVINASPGDLARVFDTMLEKAMHLCEGNFGFLSTYDGEHFNAVALRGLPEGYVQDYYTGPYLPGPNTTHDRLVRGELVVHVPNLAADKTDSPRRRAVVEILGVRSILAVPLRKDDRLLGAIHVYRKEVRPFTDKQIALLQNFAAQAVIAMENARLLTETQEALEQQTGSAEVLRVINSSPGDLSPVFDSIVETAARLCATDIAGLAIRDGDAYRYVALRALDPAWDEYARRLSFTAGRGTVTGRTLLECRVIHVPDLANDPEHQVPEIVTIGRLRTFLGVPLLREGEPIGVLSLARTRVEPFVNRQVELIRTFADQAVIAMDNARLLGELRQRTDEIAELNRGLEARVADQVEELGRVGRLKRFLAPQLAELIVSQGDEKFLESHRREIVVVFCDLRGYTAFTETAEPEEVLDFLRQYHGALGPLVSQFEGTLDQFSGDGIMVFFNDPVPIPDPAERAVKMAMAMREAAGALIDDWRKRGRDLGFGAGIAQGYATLGQIGFSERSGYTAIGTVCNVAARLCAEAKDRQVLLSQRVAAGLESNFALDEIGPLALKGLTRPVIAYNVPLTAEQAAFRLIEGGVP
ncbi:MAG TPA: GAF domain-containing protein [Stellaceae bacterium]|nr:GAF domain-containing protein [Stellaceae bacterium]